MRGFSIDMEKAIKVHNAELPTNTVLGGAKDGHGQFYAIFCRTDKETKAVSYTEKGRMLFNIRASKPKNQEAQTPGQALSAGGKVDPALIAQLVQAALNGQATQATGQVVDSEDVNLEDVF